MPLILVLFPSSCCSLRLCAFGRKCSCSFSLPFTHYVSLFRESHSVPYRIFSCPLEPTRSQIRPLRNVACNRASYRTKAVLKHPNPLCHMLLLPERSCDAGKHKGRSEEHNGSDDLRCCRPQSDPLFSKVSFVRGSSGSGRARSDEPETGRRPTRSSCSG